MTTDQKLADLINSLLPEQRLAAEHFVKTMKHMSDGEKEYFIKTWKSYTLEAYEAGLTKGKEIGLASMREEVIKLAEDLKAMNCKCIDLNSGVSSKPQLSCYSCDEIDRLIEPFAESGK